RRRYREVEQRSAWVRERLAHASIELRVLQIAVDVTELLREARERAACDRRGVRAIRDRLPARFERRAASCDADERNLEPTRSDAVGVGGQPGIATSTGITFATLPSVA